MSLHDRWQQMSPVLKSATVLFGVIAAAASALTAAAAAFPLVEPYILAHRGYVLERVGSVQTTTNELLLWKFEDAKNKLMADREGWAIQLQKENDPQTKALILNRVEQIKRDESQVDDRIQKLKAQ